ncbi:PA14 domain-containing protein [Runella slithyformis]|uniref:OmpA/MotB domain protein n=1 Tax=Runella slithyformis (strain ATCC 29530 / DSM 19594 / LMG 11500 / NCIMB 11436 / LSU 4) TaxID=761193 RepID=A0A7U3ZJH9_RUNSL|nr:PA14 domain-containing protein [Runella slithyformis]AEI48364.1 OmpA/MotB domain protein [Runella slithyformis DSM 19594]
MKTILFLSIALTATQLRAQHGLQGEYYNGQNFERKVLTRIDPQINFSWRGRSPGPNVDDSYYSVRWTGKLHPPATGVYQFSAKVDDGVRIWVGSRLIVDAWGLHDSGSFEGNVKLEEGKFYDLKIEYFNAMFEGEVQVYWKIPNSAEMQPIKTDYLYKAPAPKAAVAPAKPKQEILPVVSKPTATQKPITKTTKPAVVPAKEVPIAETQPAAAPEAPKTETTESVRYPPEKEKPVVLKHVTFEQSSYHLLPESHSELNTLADYLLKNPAVTIEIAGHTDNVGDPRLNLALSENRAKVVRHYLIQKGVAEERILAKGYGGTRPLTANANETERAQNRRVELLVH